MKDVIDNMKSIQSKDYFLQQDFNSMLKQMFGHNNKINFMNSTFRSSQYQSSQKKAKHVHISDYIARYQ